MTNINHHRRKLISWAVGSASCFALAGLLALFATDLLLVSRPHLPILQRLTFAREPMFLLSVSLPPAMFSGFAFYQWTFHNSRFFRGLLSVAAAAWLSLVFNPVVFFLVMSSLFLFGFVVLVFIFTMAIFLSAVWQLTGAAKWALAK